MRRRQVQTVMGREIPEPRVTIEGRWLAFTRLGLPLLGALFLFDLAVWALFEALFGWCVAIWCML
ncbi:MAG: hypothetical protein AAFW46_14435 [Pseudomonadota bacterium]